MRNLRVLVVPALLLAACGGKAQPKEPEKIVVEEKPKPKPPPPPPPVCVLPGSDMSLVGMVEADDDNVRFCVSDGAESNKCYGVALADGKYSELTEPPKGASSVLAENPARIETTSREVKVCIGDDCKTFKPKGMKGDNPIDAVVNAAGTYVAILMGKAESGKGSVDIYSVAKGKKVTTIKKYARQEYMCGEARMLGDTLFVSASVCAGPAARATLYNLKGKKVADVGGKEFGTYGIVPVQVTETEWAFLEEGGNSVAVQDVQSGKVSQTVALWTSGQPMALDEGKMGDDEAPPDEAEQGNPGESALVRAGEGKLVVVSGGPNPGSVSVINLADGTTNEVKSLVCDAPPAASADEGGEEELGAESDEGGE